MCKVTLRQELLPHPLAPRGPIQFIFATVQHSGGRLSLAFTAAGAIDKVLVPSPAQPARADGLWQHTCFEMFMRRPGDDAYLEFNFSPSGEWAAYAFDGYRSGMRPLDTAPPSSRLVAGADTIELLVSLPLPPQEWNIGLSAIIEDAQGAISYWAICHPSDKPDFHHPGGFALHFPGLRT